MTDEEKKAIERLKNIAIYIGDNYTFSQQGIRNLRENLRIVLPVIEKQSKEIEILNENMNLLREQNISYKQSIHGLKEINKIINKKWKDKIKAKIEELEKEKNIPKEIDFKAFYRIKDLKNIEIKVLESILEKE